MAASAALTTVFTPPTSCFNNQYTSSAASIFVKDTLITSSECYPTSYHPLFTEGIPYSPGVCPSDYVAASTASYSDDATAALCCPSSWQPYDGGLGCHTSLAGPSSLALPDGNTIAPSGAYLAMHGVYVAWASSDLGSFTPASAPLLTSPVAVQSVPTSSTSSTTSSTTSSATSSSSSSSTTSSSISIVSSKPSSHDGGTIPAKGSASSSQKPLPASFSSTNSAITTVFVTPDPPVPTQHSLSTGAQAGIGVGAAAGGLSLVGLGFLTLARRRRRPRSLPVGIQDFGENTQPSGKNKLHISELSAEGAMPNTAEADSTAIPVELEGSPRILDNGTERL